KELREAEQLTRGNTRMTLYMCVNYGGRAEIIDAVRAIAEEARAGRISGRGITAKSFARHLDDPDMPDVDLFLRTSGEQRTSNFMLWQAAYAELVFVPELWPDVDRRVLWRAVTEDGRRDRRVGGAIHAPDEDPTAGCAGCADGPPAVLDVGPERASWADSAASCGSTSAAEMPPVRRLCRSSTATSVTTRASTATAPQGETRNSSNQAMKATSPTVA